MVDTPVEITVDVVAGNGAFKVFGESRFIIESIHINGVEVVTTISPTLDLVSLVVIRLCCEVPGVGRRVDHTSSLLPVNDAVYWSSKVCDLP